MMSLGHAWNYNLWAGPLSWFDDKVFRDDAYNEVCIEKS
jgi:hypothetical protein